MSPRTRRTRSDRGFALVITLSLMVLLTIIAVGLLTLGTISLRSASAGDAQAQAYANARLAVMMAIGQLQKQAGDDRRVTADNSILDKTAVDNSAEQSYAAGVWTGWSPKFDASPTQAAMNYSTKKTDSFRGWLMSAPTPADLKKPDYPKSAVSSDAVKLFTVDLNGFDLSAAKVPMKTGDMLGSMAWVTTQENTKAKVTVDGPDKLNALPVNAVVQAPPRPSLHAAVGLQNPKDGFSTRTNKVVSLNQIRLDDKLAGGNVEEVQKVGTSYTVYSQGLLTDAVNGGLKTDLSLGFEMTDADWAKGSWGSTANPFRRATLPYKDTSNNNVNIPTSFAQQVPLFRPLPGLENPIVSVDVPYDVANVSQKFYAAGVPTFDHLRSFYRIPRYLYGGSGSSLTVAERSADHIASKTTGGAGYTLSPSKPFNASTTRKSVTSIKPVLNRMVYLFSMKLSSEDKVQVVITPVVSLWNPYNIALDIDGAVAYPWIDVPFQLNWNINRPGGTSSSANLALSRMMGYQYEGAGHGRQVNPYFLCQMTATGTNNISNQPIHFEPGEVRVFAPAKTTPVDYIRTAPDGATTTIWMRPVDSPSQFTTQGGLVVKMDGGVGGDGNSFNAKMSGTDTATLNMTPSSQGSYHYFVSLEDATRIRTPGMLNVQGGVSTQDVEMLNFVSTYTSAQSPVMSYGALKQPKPAPFAVVETFHRTATSDVVGSPGCDLVFSMNPRNPGTSHVLAAAISGNVPKTAPHYQSTMRGVTDFAQALQVTSDGRRSFWGSSHSSSGSSILPFFDIPREPMLSLAGFQSADLSSSAYAPSYTIGNSMASAWLRRTIVARQQPNLQTGGVQVSTMPIYDTTYLGNELLWDGYFFSGAAAVTSPGSRPSNLQTAYDKAGSALETKSVAKVIEDWVQDQDKNPLGNARMRLHQGSAKQNDLIKDLSDPAGCAVMAAHVMLDGAFNINSTDKAAWIAVLSSLRGQPFQLESGANAPTTDTSFPRMRHPTGSANGTWDGFRTLSDAQIEGLAKEIVNQVKQRGPFQSVGEFVNRRVENSELGRCGAIQGAIDALKLNTSMLKTSFLPTFYPSDSQTNLVKFTEAGIPGFLSQGDVMQGLGSMITCRSDTFVIRGYGEAKDAKGNVTAKAWCEAVVQRMPEFVDANVDAPQIPVATLKSVVNQNFGRRFEIVSIRRIPRPEAVGTGSLASAP